MKMAGLFENDININNAKKKMSLLIHCGVFCLTFFSITNYTLMRFHSDPMHVLVMTEGLSNLHRRGPASTLLTPLCFCRVFSTLFSREVCVNGGGCVGNIHEFIFQANG